MPADVSTLLEGRYELRDRVGTGGFSEVWRAHDRVLERPVAIKLLDEKYARDPEALARFRSEAHNAGCLSHGNIARVYDFGEPGPPHPAYLVMELVDGPTLANVLQDGPLDPVRCMDVIAQAAAGLHQAHLRGLVHRDVKPANLLLSADAVKVADFGISHALDSAALTMTGVVIGSPGYVAPERAAGASATPSSDLYALGVVAYECLVGAPPFRGTGLEVALAHVNQPFPVLPEHVPAEVAAFVAKLTSKDPALRPPDAAAVAQKAGQLRDDLLAGLAESAHAPHEPGLHGREPGLSWRQPGLSCRQPGLSWRQPGLGWRRPARGTSEKPGVMPPRWRRRVGTTGRMVAAAAAAICLLVGLVLVSMLSSAATPSVASARHLPSRAHGSSELSRGDASGSSVVVHVRSLVGRPVAPVVRQLHGLGLATRVIRRPTAAQPPGKVVTVYPGGRRPLGSMITIVAAVRRPSAGQDARRTPASSGGPNCAGQPGPGERQGKDSGHGHGDGQCNGHGMDPGGRPAAQAGDGNSQNGG